MGSHKEKNKSRKKDSKSSKKHKKRRRNSSSSEDEKPDFVRDAEQAHVAAEYVRCILRKFPAMKSELRDLLWRIDSGEGVKIDGLSDKDMLRGLQGLFKGTYTLKPGQDKTLRRIGVVFSEALEQASDLPLRLPCDQKSADESPVGSPRGVQPPKDDEGHRQTETEELETVPSQNPPRVLGPAAAPDELLQAAAEVAAEMQAEGLLGDVLSGLPASFVGPVPAPEVIADADNASLDTREREVTRITELFESREEADPYQILGIEASAATNEIRKRFWRLSLLVHPDKCKHEQAAAAFNAIKKATEILMDAEAREKMDAKREKEAEDKLNSRVLAELEQERKWRLAQGIGTEEDHRGPIGRGDQQQERDDWMTSLPEKRAAKPGYMGQVSVSSFSSHGVGGGDTSDPSWTQIPGQPAPQQLHVTFSTPGVTRQPKLARDSIAEKNSRLLAIAKQQLEPQQKERTKSLMEKHQIAQEEKASEERRQRKQAKRVAGPSLQVPQEQKPEWAQRSAWRPFDREKDLNIQKPGSMGPPKSLSLSSRFKPAGS